MTIQPVVHAKSEGGRWNDPNTWVEGVVPTDNACVIARSLTIHQNGEWSIKFTPGTTMTLAQGD